MRCSRCGDDLIPANLTTLPSGERICARELYAIVLQQLAHKTPNVPTRFRTVDAVRTGELL